MYQIRHFTSYLTYKLRAGNEHSLHPPFIYKLYTEVIKPQKNYYAFNMIESLRKELLHNHKKITISDLGAGSKVSKKRQRKISSIAKNSLNSNKSAALLFRLINHFKPKHIVELGTSLGINTLYLAASDKKSQLSTFEGCHDTVEIAQQLFKKADANHIHIVKGNIDNTLPPYLNEIAQVDFAYIDANHTYEATMRYFKLLSEKRTINTCIAIDDIHWSSGMEKAWKEIKNHSEVTLSIDLYDLGIVFFLPHLQKSHYVLAF